MALGCGARGAPRARDAAPARGFGRWVSQAPSPPGPRAEMVGERRRIGDVLKGGAVRRVTYHLGAWLPPMAVAAEPDDTHSAVASYSAALIRAWAASRGPLA